MSNERYQHGAANFFKLTAASEMHNSETKHPAFQLLELSRSLNMNCILIRIFRFKNHVDTN
jgi:hypothetical protein